MITYILTSMSKNCIPYDDALRLQSRVSGVNVSNLHQGCELVIALSHMRTFNDLRLLEETEGIDLILGGHDHDYEVHKVSDGAW